MSCDPNQKPFTQACYEFNKADGAGFCNWDPWSRAPMADALKSQYGPLPLKAVCIPQPPNKEDFAFEPPHSLAPAQWRIHDPNFWAPSTDGSTACNTNNDLPDTLAFDCTFPPLTCDMARDKLTGGMPVAGRESVKYAVYSKGGGAGGLNSGYIYIPPRGHPLHDAKKLEAEAGGFHIPFGCETSKVNIANPESPSPSSSSFVREGLDDTPPPPPKTGCSSEIMKPLKGACEAISRARLKNGPAPHRSNCDQSAADKAAFAAKMAATTQEPWFGKVLDNITSFPNTVVNAPANIIASFGSSNESKQKISNSLGINIDINQSTQAQQMCLNNAKIQQSNTTHLKDCPNPYKTLMNNICGAQPCQWDEELVVLSNGTQACQKISPKLTFDTSAGNTREFQASKWQYANTTWNACLQTPATQKKLRDLLSASVKFQAEVGKNNVNVDIKQNASAKISQKCNQNVKMEAVQSTTAGINNLIAQQLKQKASGFMTGNTAEQDICNDVNVNVSSCQSSVSQACCSNTSATDQKNEIVATIGCSPGAIKINQNLDSSIEQMCAQGVETKLKSTTTADIKNKVAQKAIQTAETPNIFSMFIIIAIIIGIIILSPIGLFFVIGKKIILIIGIIILIIGVGLFPAYFAASYKGGCLKNAPFVTTSSKDAKLISFAQTTWNGAKSTYDKDDKIAAFDFFPTCITFPDMRTKGLVCSSDISDGHKSYPDVKPVPGNSSIFKYPDGTPGLAMYYSFISKAKKSGVKATTRGTGYARGGATGSATDWQAYNVKTAGYRRAGQGTVANPEGVPSCPVFTSTGTCPMQQTAYDQAKTDGLLRAAIPSDPVTPSLTYVKDYSDKKWLYSAIGTTVMGALFTAAGVMTSMSGSGSHTYNSYGGSRSQQFRSSTMFNSGTSKSGGKKANDSAKTKSSTARRRSTLLS